MDSPWRIFPFFHVLADGMGVSELPEVYLGEYVARERVGGPAEV